MRSSITQRLSYLVADARSDVKFYERLYRGTGSVRNLADFKALPAVTPAAYSRHGLRDKLSNLADICITRTICDHNKRGCLPRLLSYDDVIRDQESSYWLLKSAGAWKRRQRVLIVTTEAYSYALAEVGKTLSLCNWAIAAVTTNGLASNPQLPDVLDPTLLVLDANASPETASLFRATVLKFQTIPPLATAAGGVAGEVLFDTTVGNYAARRAGDNVFTYNPDHFYIETVDGGKLAVTSFIHRLQPLIRFVLPFCGRTVSGSGFVVVL